MKNFNKILYINLDFRTDRKEHMLKQFQRLSVKKKQIQRISAVHTPVNGHRGCALSHIRALELAIARTWNNVLILEDDCDFYLQTEYIDPFIDYFFSQVHNDWDVFLLGGKIQKKEPRQEENIYRVLEASNAYAYAVNRRYMPILLENFKEAYALLREDAFPILSQKTPIDQHWKKLQEKDLWLMGEIIIAAQKPFESNIEKKAYYKNDKLSYLL